jgi:DNA-binding transcriptional LysR family regulator
MRRPRSPSAFEDVSRRSPGAQSEHFRCAHLVAVATGGPSEHAIKTSRVQPRQILEFEHGATALAMVRHGMGVTVFPSSITAALDTKGLELLTVSGKLAQRLVGAISRRGASLSEAAQNFSDMSKTAMQKNAKSEVRSTLRSHE